MMTAHVGTCVRRLALFAWLLAALAIGCGGDDLEGPPDARGTGEQSSRKELAFFGFTKARNPSLPSDVIATIDGTSIRATLPFGTNLDGLIASFTSTGLLVAVGDIEQRSGVTVNNFTNVVIYRVLAEDRTFRNFTVAVTAAPSNAKELTAFRFNAAPNGLASDVVATITGTSITATVPFGTDLTELVATYSATGTSVTVAAVPQLSGVTPNDFTEPVVYRVTAADGGAQEYTVTLDVELGTTSQLTSYVFERFDNAALSVDVWAQITGTNVTAVVPYGTTVNALVGTFTHNGVAVTVGGAPQLSGFSAHNFMSPVVYRVTAEDGTFTDFTVTVEIAPNPASALTSFVFTDTANPALTTTVTAAILGSNITATVPLGTDVTALVATFTTTGVSVTVGGVVQVSGTTPNDFTSTVPYRVYAADSTFRTYVVTVTIADPVVCETLPDPVGGTVTQSNGGIYPSTATYTCHTGYAINPVGGVARTCQSPSGLYTGTAPACDPTFMVVRLGTGGGPLVADAATATFVEERRLADGSVIRTIALPTAASGAQHALTVSATGALEGALSLSSDGRYVTLAGYDAPPDTPTPHATAAATVARVVGRIGTAGVVDTSTAITDAFSGTSIRSATTQDGTQFWTTGATSGVRQVVLGSTGSSTSIVASEPDLRCIANAGGNLLVGHGAPGAGVLSQIGTGFPSTGPAPLTPIAATIGVPNGFAFVDADPSVPGLDTLYVAVEAAPMSNALNVQKWTLAATWTQDPDFRPTIPFSSGTRGLTAFRAGGVTHLIVATVPAGQSGNNNQLRHFIDDGVDKTPPAILVGAAGPNFGFRGVARSPFVP